MATEERTHLNTPQSGSRLNDQVDHIQRMGKGCSAHKSEHDDNRLETVRSRGPERQDPDRGQSIQSVDMMIGIHLL